jgi:hypothetical protein
MTNAAQAADGLASPHSVRAPSDRATGYLITCGLTALFWTALFAVLAPTFGLAVSPLSCTLIALAIGGFLTAVFSALTIGPRE